MGKRTRQGRNPSVKFGKSVPFALSLSKGACALANFRLWFDKLTMNGKVPALH
jgi:hypothetical protein